MPSTGVNWTFFLASLAHAFANFAVKKSFNRKGRKVLAKKEHKGKCPVPSRLWYTARGTSCPFFFVTFVTLVVKPSFLTAKFAEKNPNNPGI